MPKSNLPHLKSKYISTPAHLYIRGNLYYFRTVLPWHPQRNMAGKRKEIRLSLKTSYLRAAKNLAQKIHFHLTSLLEGNHMISYEDLKYRLNQFLKRLLEHDHCDLSKRPEYRDPQIGLDLSHGEMQECHARNLTYMTQNKDSLERQAPEVIQDMINAGIITREEATENNYLKLAKAYIQMLISYKKILAKREKGDFLAEEPIFAAYSNWQPKELAQPALKIPEAKLATPPTMLYSEALKKYCEAKLSDGSWKQRLTGDHYNRLKPFMEIIGDLPINAISREIMRSFRETMRRLPPNRHRSPQYKNMSIQQILDSKPTATLNIKTVNVTVEAIASLLEWCIREGHLSSNTQNPAKNLQIKDTRKAIELREPFSMADLTQIFNHKNFANGGFKNPAYFWIPLIALYTGMRLEEISQLYCNDIKNIDGIWIFNINELNKNGDTLDKSVKNSNAVRIVPIHKALKDLGFLDYHKQIESQNNIRLFPELNKNSEVSKYGKQPGKRFKAVVDSALENTGKKSFHSLRHTFADFYKQKGWQTDFFRQLYGHDNPALATKQYGSNFPAKLLYEEVISKLDYGLDLSHLKPPSIQKNKS